MGASKDHAPASVGASTRPVFADLTLSEAELSRLSPPLQRLLEASDITFHIPPPKPFQESMEHLDKLIEKRHLGLEDPMLYHKGVHIHYPDNLESQPKDKLRVSFCSWNPDASRGTVPTQLVKCGSCSITKSSRKLTERAHLSQLLS